MTVIVKILVPSKFLENVQTTQYTSVNVRTLIDSATVTNNGASATALSIYLVNNGGAADLSNRFIAALTIQAGESYDCPEIVRHVLQPGDFISTLAGAASSLACRIGGRTIS